jgi:hypothetical protein
MVVASIIEMKRLVPGISFVLLAFMLQCCFFVNRKENNPQHEQDIRYLLQKRNAGKNFVNAKYLNEKPVAQLINMPAYSELDTSFVLKKDTKIQIYATGELNVGLTVNPQYFFQSDDMEFFFDLNNEKSDAFMNQADDHMFIFSWLDGKVKSDTVSFWKQGAEYRGNYDSKKKDYVAEIAFPWKYFNRTEVTQGYCFGFELAIGDNDDGIMQKAKIAWNSTGDALATSTRSYGNLLLVKDSIKPVKEGVMVSNYKSPVMDGIAEPLWMTLPSYKVKNLIMGSIGNVEDLSASVKTCWDATNLYFLVKVHDNSKKVVKHEGIRRYQSFHDYGWIEDQQGNKVWDMHCLDSKYAGGAYKNQQIDTVIHLKAGKYTLKYISDESHTWNNWDDLPPLTPFYGVVLYNTK